MSITLTQNAQNASRQLNIEPQLVLEIEGVTTVYGASPLIRYIRVGDPGLEIGNDWVVGGFSSVADQDDLISLEGSSQQINQQLNPDKAEVTSVSSVQITLVDKGGAITSLISPGVVVDDILYRRAKLYMGFKNTSFPEDFTLVFRGIIDDVISDQGKVLFNIAHPDQKKRQTIFQKVETNLNYPGTTLNNSATTITVDATADFLAPVNGPDGTNDESLLFYVKIDDEIIQYTGKTSTTFAGCTRGALGTVAAEHDDDATVESFYRLKGNCIDLMLKLMLSGWNGAFESGVAVEAFNQVTSTENIDDAISFQGIDVEDKYGLKVGDFVTTVDADNAENIVTLQEITAIETTDFGSYIVCAGAGFVTESDSPATISFRSQYDTLGEGLKMHSDEVDIAQHLEIQRLYLSSLEYDFYLKDTVNGKDFINKEICLPAAMYAVPRKARSSVQYHIGPVPGANTVTLNDTNVVNASKLKLRRTTSKNFYNTVVYKFDEDTLEEKFLSGYIITDATSKTQIPAGNRSLTIVSKGLRASLSAASQAAIQGARTLNRYKFAAEFIDDVQILFSAGLTLEIGDVLLLDGSNLNLSDTSTGLRGMTIRYFEVVNKKFDLKTGKILVSLLNTGYSTANRYALIGPASQIKTGISTTQFVIESGPYSSSIFGVNEGRKWSRFTLPQVRVRNSDFTNNSTSIITNVSGNTITVSPALSFTPSAGDILELSAYLNSTEQVKILYCFMSDADFADGKLQNSML